MKYLDRTFDGVSWSVGVDNFDAVLTSAETEVYAHCALAGRRSRAGASAQSADRRGLASVCQGVEWPEHGGLGSDWLTT